MFQKIEKSVKVMSKIRLNELNPAEMQLIKVNTNISYIEKKETNNKKKTNLMDSFLSRATNKKYFLGICMRSA